MTQLTDLTCPVMRRFSGLHRSQIVRLFGQERQNLTPGQLFAENHRPVVECPVQMENVLCKINADDGSVCHADASSFYAFMALFDDTWHIVVPSGDGIHTINFFPYLSKTGVGTLGQSRFKILR